MDFSAAIAAQLAGDVVRVDALVEFQFASETIRLWNGFGQLTTSDAKTWEGLSGLGSISGIDQSINGSAPTQTFTVSGVDSRFAARAKGAQAEYYRQPVLTYLQFFDEDWQTLDAPFAVAFRQMDTIKARREMTDDGPVFTVSVTAETPFITRRRPPNGYFTDRHQKLIDPADLGLAYTAGIDGKSILFPDW
ncbi:hypothetical protein [Acuticoccus sediminis]|uniref:hypothetical protein n=1 Tax=Acuticoccus sediminis TaxID=2184697 RepID=UPI001CFDBFCD|nr:hypothetical protein [Acuticoccus sediminis]